MFCTKMRYVAHGPLDTSERHPSPICQTRSMCFLVLPLMSLKLGRKLLIIFTESQHDGKAQQIPTLQAQTT